MRSANSPALKQDPDSIEMLLAFTRHTPPLNSNGEEEIDTLVLFFSSLFPFRPEFSRKTGDRELLSTSKAVSKSFQILMARISGEGFSGKARSMSFFWALSDAIQIYFFGWKEGTCLLNPLKLEIIKE